MKKLLLAAAIAVMLSGCGGGADAVAAVPVPLVFVQPSDRIIPNTGYSIQVQPTPVNSVLPDVVSDVARQAALGPNVMLWIGGRTDEVVQRFPSLLNEAKKYPNIKIVYLYDELFWSPTGIQIGLHEAEVMQAAALTHQAGLETAITFLPEVILSPGFAMQDINAFDIIAIDVYPSIRADNNTYGCSYSSNILENLLRCSIDKLRAKGYQGKIGYIYQAFELNSLPAETSFAHAALQRPVIDGAKDYGVDFLIPWGLYLGAAEIAAEPYLSPLGGSQYEYLVAPPGH